MVTVFLNGCITSWQPQSAAPAQVLQATGDDEVRVTLKSGTNVLLRDPAVEGDSLVGWQAPQGDVTGAPVVRQALALSDVSQVSVRKSNTGANIAVGVGIGAGLFLASVVGVVWVACHGGGCD